MSEKITLVLNILSLRYLLEIHIDNSCKLLEMLYRSLGMGSGTDI